MPDKKQVFGFSEPKAQRLSTLADQMPGSSSGALHQVGNAVGLWVMQATTAITACTVVDPGTGPETIPGTGMAKICWRDPADNKIKTNGPTPLTGTVFNLALKESIAQDTYFYGFRDLAGTLWVISLLHPGQCQDFVTKVEFDVATCQLIVCTRQVCFPPGVVIGPENCGGGSGGSGVDMGGE